MIVLTVVFFRQAVIITENESAFAVVAKLSYSLFAAETFFTVRLSILCFLFIFLNCVPNFDVCLFGMSFAGFGQLASFMGLFIVLIFP